MCKQLKNYRIKRTWIKVYVGSFIFIIIGLYIFLRLHKNELVTLVKQTNYDLMQYDKLHEYKDYYALKDVGLSSKEILEIKRSYNNNSLSENKDSIIAYFIINYYKERIIENIKKIMNNDTFARKDIIKLLDDDLIKMAKSEDNKLFNFSFDAKTFGVSHKKQVSMVCHIESYSSENTREYKNESKETVVYKSFPNGYDSIHAITTNRGVKYLLLGHEKVQGCYFVDHISLLEYINGEFIQEFNYSIFHTGAKCGISYDKIKGNITVVYAIDSSNRTSTRCHCRENKDMASENSKQSQIKMCTCTFRFNGNTFEFMDENIEMVKIQ